MSWTPITFLQPYVCRVCGVSLRNVNTIGGEFITIEEEPASDGNIIPWPSSSPTGLAQARILDVPVSDGPMWRLHNCR